MVNKPGSLQHKEREHHAVTFDSSILNKCTIIKDKETLKNIFWEHSDTFKNQFSFIPFDVYVL